ncbi:MAG: ABC transporter transmembrane domain-containing protein [Bryobacterales bacterium]
MNEEAPIGKVYDARLLRRLLRYLRPYGSWVAASICLLVLHSVLGVTGPYLTKIAIDHSLNPQPGVTSPLDSLLPADRWDSLQIIVLIYLAVQLLSFVFRGAQIHVMNYTGQRVMFDLRNEIFRHLQGMGVRFYDRNPIGRLVTRVTTDVDMLNELFTSGVVAIAGDLITLLFILGVMIHLSPQLTLVLMTVSPLVLVATIWFRRRARQSYRDVRLAVAKINSFLQEHFGGIAVVQIFNHEGRSWEQFNEINAEHRDAQYQAIRAHAYFLPLVEWFGVLGLALLLVYGGYLVSNTPTTIGVVVAFLMYGTRVFRPLQDLSDKYNILQSAMASSERIFGLLDTPADEELGVAEEADTGRLPSAFNVPISAKTEASPSASPRVQFQNVWFAYQDEQWVLRDVSFTVEPGEMVAIVGHTGAGKTTLISLLLRFYEVQKGTIVVGGRDIRDWPVEELRRQFGIVLQDPCLFSGTIESNIRLSNGGVSDERLREVIREVNLETFVSTLPRGVQEPILERGASLSSGQKQLLSFARALAFNPRFLILDEATSSVDTETEFKIREALTRMLAGHTSIVIAHRLSTIQKASRIVVLHKGEVRETGNHQELLANRGIYYKLYQLQYRDQELPSAAVEAADSHGDAEPQLAPQLESEPLPRIEPTETSPPQAAASASLLTVEPVVSADPFGPAGLSQPLVPVNGAEQDGVALGAPARQGTPNSGKPAGGFRNRRRGKKPSQAAGNQPPEASPPAQLSLSLEKNESPSGAETAPNSPVTSAPATGPVLKPRRKRGKRKRKNTHQ